MMKFLEIAEKSMIFSKFMEFSVLRAIHPPETLIFLRNYWCFRDASIFVEFFIFTKTAKFCEKIIIYVFSHFVAQKSHFAESWPKGSRNHKICMEFHWF